MNGSILRRSFGERYFSASNPATEPPKRTGNALTSKRVIGPIPLRPSSKFFHAVSTVLPTGETIPNPVMTTRRLDKRRPHEGNDANEWMPAYQSAIPGE